MAVVVGPSTHLNPALMQRSGLWLRAWGGCGRDRDRDMDTDTPLFMEIGVIGEVRVWRGGGCGLYVVGM